jgi:hypothetical protein
VSTLSSNRSSPTSPAVPWLIFRPGRQRGVAVDRGRGAQPGPRRRHTGQPAVRQSPAATIRRDLSAFAARTARHGRGHITLHLPEGTGTVSTSGSTCSPRPAARPPQRPDQPTGPHPDGPDSHPAPRPRAGTPDKTAEQVSGRKPRPSPHPDSPPGKLLAQESDRKTPTGTSRWIEAKDCRELGESSVYLLVSLNLQVGTCQPRGMRLQSVTARVISL